MNHNLGKKMRRIRTNLACVIPLFYTVAALLMIGLLVLPMSTAGDNPLYGNAVTAVAILLMVYILVEIFHNHIMLHENAIVIVSTFGKKVIMRDDIAVIHWDKPGVHEGTTRAVVRKNNETAEIMIKGGKMVKLTDAAYKSMPKHLGEWQTQQNIPREY